MQPRGHKESHQKSVHASTHAHHGIKQGQLDREEAVKSSSRKTKLE